MTLANNINRGKIIVMQLHWKEYSNFEDEKKGQFQYALVKVE